VSCASPLEGAQILLTFHALRLDCAISGLGFTPSDHFLISATILREERFESPTGQLYMYYITSVVREQQWLAENLSGSPPPLLIRNAA
jgi:hypothetical protein